MRESGTSRQPAVDLGVEGATGPGDEGAVAPADEGAARSGAEGLENPEGAAMGICLRLLTAAPRTRAQLADALQRRGVPEQAADAVLGRLAAARLIDDWAFAQAWVESRHYSRGLAARALSAELRQRGISDGDVRAAVAALSPEQEEAAARRLVDAKLAATRGKPATARVRRLTGLLARKGYPPGLAYRVVREALEQEGIDPAAAGLDTEAVLDADADGLDGLDSLDG
jgi:regulatory protein